MKTKLALMRRSRRTANILGHDLGGWRQEDETTYKAACVKCGTEFVVDMNNAKAFVIHCGEIFCGDKEESDGDSVHNTVP